MIAFTNSIMFQLYQVILKYFITVLTCLHTDYNINKCILSYRDFSFYDISLTFTE